MSVASRRRRTGGLSVFFRLGSLFDTSRAHSTSERPMVTCFTLVEIGKLRRLLDLQFTRDACLLALLRSEWDLDHAERALLAWTPSEESGPLLCSGGCGRSARVQVCCRACASPAGPHSNMCRRLADHRVSRAVSHAAAGPPMLARGAKITHDPDDACAAGEPTVADEHPTVSSILELTGALAGVRIQGCGAKSPSSVPTPIARPEPANWRPDLPIFVVLRPTTRRPLGVYNMPWDLREKQEGLAKGTLAVSSCHPGLSLRRVSNWQEAVQQWESRFPREPVSVFTGFQ